MSRASATEERIVGRVLRRLIPFLFLCYTVNYIDRVNVGFAALEMNLDLGFSKSVYGLGAAMFFIGYVIFEIPSNLILERVGARIWIARIMITWGLLSSSMATIHSARAFYVLRLLLGVAEAGFFPGMIYYLSYWVPARRRARAAAWFLTSTSLSGVFGAPLSGYLMRLGGRAGLAGWQWLFLLEGIPAVLLGLVVLGRLDDRVADAAWLAPADRRWLERRLAREHAATHAAHGHSLRDALLHPDVWRLGLLYFAIIISFYGVTFWVPQIVQGLTGLPNFTVSMLSALPFLCAAVAMVLVGHHSDETGERRRHIAGAALVGALGLALAGGTLGTPAVAFAGVCVAGAGIWSTLGPFWSLPFEFLTGTAAAGGIALVNSCGSVGGFVGSYAIGFLKDQTGTYAAGLWFLAATLAAGAWLAVRLPAPRRRP